MSEQEDPREPRSEPRSEQRIAELEAEVSRLKGQLADGEAPGPGRPPRAEENLAPSRVKMILVGIGIAIVALAGFALIFSALSSGFDSLAQKAAKSLVSDDPGAGSGSATPKQVEPPSPHAPGL